MSSHRHEPDEQHDWMTLDEYAAEMRVTRRTVERWIARGELEVLKHGRVTRIHRSLVERDEREDSPPTMRATVHTIRR